MYHEAQYRKIEKAYLEYQISVECPHCNFVGTLLNNNPYWALVIEEYELIEGQIVPHIAMNKESLYKGLMTIEAEGEMFYGINDILELERKWRSFRHYMTLRNVATEEALYRTLNVTLNLLKEIHIRKGERVRYSQFPMREPGKMTGRIYSLEGVNYC